MDLNIIIEDQGQRDNEQTIANKLLACKALGFHTVALNVIIEMTSDKGNKKNSITVPKPPQLDASNIAVPKDLKVLTRLTVKISETMHIHTLGKCKERNDYDLLAYEPQNPKILGHLAAGNADFEILTFNMGERMDFALFKISLKLLEERGVCFEICYGPAHLGTSLRRNIICNGQNLVEKCKRTVILSNGIKDAFRLHSPKDAKYIGTLFLMSLNTSHDAVFNNARQALSLAKCRSNPIASAIVLKSALT